MVATLAAPRENAAGSTGPLFDKFGRAIRNLRVSITDRCNFRCTYCMPAEGLDWLPKEQILTYEEIERLVRLFVRLGVEEVRLTGGEPTVRRDLPTLIHMLAPLRELGLKSLSLTTNGILLEKLAGPLAEAGLTRINVSLDTLDPQKFFAITRRRALDQVLAGLEALERYPQISPIKINAVAIRGFTTEDDVLALAALARRKPYVMRFIEYMPLDAEGNWNLEQVLTGEELRAIIDRKWPLVPVAGTDPSSTSVVYRFADGSGEMGFINPVSQPFCATCDRIRLTADGQLRTCLFSIDETDLKTPLRTGVSDSGLEEIVRGAVWEKEKKHKINEGDAFQRASRSMSQIGG
ncbi:MAG TPA: GTP 3',8-cyclase MoaA [Chloroflexota bacterium]|nr:GTP 3',8-cyclase MoaA [Chloroflexota bacterium]